MASLASVDNASISRLRATLEWSCPASMDPRSPSCAGFSVLDIAQHVSLTYCFRADSQVSCGKGEAHVPVVGRRHVPTTTSSKHTISRRARMQNEICLDPVVPAQKEHHAAISVSQAQAQCRREASPRFSIHCPRSRRPMQTIRRRQKQQDKMIRVQQKVTRSDCHLRRSVQSPRYHVFCGLAYCDMHLDTQQRRCFCRSGGRKHPWST